jgi:hypothetical protein
VHGIPKMIEAGNAVRRAAVIVMAAMRGARERVMRGFAPPREEEGDRVRVAPVRARVAEPEQTAGPDEFADEEEVEPRNDRKKV